MGYKAKFLPAVSFSHAPNIPELYVKWARAQENETEQWTFIGAILAAVRRTHKTAWKNKKWGDKRPDLPNGRFEVVINLCATSKIPIAGALPIKDGFVRVRKIT